MRSIIWGTIFLLVAGFSWGGDAVPLGELSLQAVTPISPPPTEYRDPKNIRYQTGAGIAVASNGRLWVTIMTGGDDEDVDNYVDLITSGDGGETWSEPIFSLDIPGPMRTFDPAIWTDPDGRVWWFWTQVYDFWDGRGGLWAMKCDRPENADAVWSAPERLCDGVMKDKPLVTSDGAWWLHVEQWQMDAWSGHRIKDPTAEWVHDTSDRFGANLYASSDHGATWRFLSGVHVPTEFRTCDEHMTIERRDGTFRMLLRTKYGMGEAISRDHGQTWSDVVPSSIKNPPARFFFARLKSGNILLIKNGPLDFQTDRRDLTAYLSEDDGETFPYSLTLDARENVAYPDACQDGNGVIYSVHDFDRRGKGEIILDCFTEEDIKAGKIISPAGRLHRLVRQNGGGN